jgi:hypothetical protein
MLWRVWIRSLDLNEAFRADVLTTAACVIQIRRIVEEANRALAGIFVKHSLQRRAINSRLVR